MIEFEYNISDNSIIFNFSTLFLTSMMI
jgi:hypothetical protein